MVEQPDAASRVALVGSSQILCRSRAVVQASMPAVVRDCADHCTYQIRILTVAEVEIIVDLGLSHLMQCL